ncbi:MAG TPA: hypothetical protein VF682_19925 [Pseudomonas sp.]|jgi:hypothetical protein
MQEQFNPNEKENISGPTINPPIRNVNNYQADPKRRVLRFDTGLWLDAEQPDPTAARIIDSARLLAELYQLRRLASKLAPTGLAGSFGARLERHRRLHIRRAPFAQEIVEIDQERTGDWHIPGDGHERLQCAMNHQLRRFSQTLLRMRIFIINIAIYSRSLPRTVARVDLESGTRHAAP